MSSNTAPFEVIAPQYTLYWAVVGSLFPAVDAAPDAGTWNKVGTAGPLNYDEEGVSVEPSQELAFWRSLGDSGSRKAFRKSEDMKFGLLLVDMTLEHLRHAFNRNAITTTAAGMGTAGTKEIGLSRGFAVDTVALLLRADISPYLEVGAHQFQIWRATQTGQPKPMAVKEKPMGWALEWTALVDPDQSEFNRFGKLVVQTAAALT